MRKIIVECQISDLILKLYDNTFFEVVKSFELVEILMLDLEHGKKVGIAKVVFNPGYSSKDIELPSGGVLVGILEETDGQSILLIRGIIPPSYSNLSKEFSIDVIWTTPTIMTRDHITYSIIGEEKELKKILQLIETHLGKIEQVTYEKATFIPHDLIRILTNRQREILLLAKKGGYYSNPRKITLESLSQMTGLSKTTIAEHLRKAENHIINSLLAGY